MRRSVQRGASIYKVEDDVTFEKKDIRNVLIDKEADVVWGQIPIGKCSFTILSKEKLSFANGEKVQVFFDDALQGDFFVVDFKQKSKFEWVVEAEDIFSKLEKQMFIGGIFKDTGYTPYTDAKSILEYISRESGVQFNVQDELSNVILRGYIELTDCKDALRQVCFASRSIAVANEEVIDIYIPEADNSTEILPRRILSGMEINQESTLIRGIEFEYFWRFQQYTTNSEIAFFSTEGSVGDYVYVGYGIGVTEVTVQNATIIKQSDVAVLIRLEEWSSGTSGWGVTVERVDRESTQITKYSPSIISSNDKLSKISGTYIYPTDAEAWLQEIYNSISNEKKINCKIASGKTTTKRPSFYGDFLYGEAKYGEKITIETVQDEPVKLGDVLSLTTEYGESFRGIVTRENYKLNSYMLVKNVEIREVS